MRTRFLSTHRLADPLRRTIAVGACLILLLSALPTSQAQTGSPVGTNWDCVISGKRNGVAYLSFYNNGTVLGYEILVPQAPAATHTVLLSDPLVTGPLGVQPPSTNSTTNIFGYFPVSGSWGFDSKGHVIGFYLEVVEGSICTTNMVPLSTNEYVWPAPVSVTNVFTDTICITIPIATNTLAGTFTNQSVCYSNEVDCAGAFTNTVNFSGKAVPGKRLTLTGKTSIGSVTIRGVPAVNLTNLGGTWYGLKKQNQTTFYEFFSLTNLLLWPNTYSVSGSGAGYTYIGVAGLSSQKKIALALGVFNMDGSYESTRAVFGPFNSRKLSANTSGVDAPTGPMGATNRVNFQITKRTTVP
jgi:hypothetical protein